MINSMQRESNKYFAEGNFYMVSIIEQRQYKAKKRIEFCRELLKKLLKNKLTKPSETLAGLGIYE